MFLNEGFASLHLCWVKGVDLGNFGDEVRFEFNGVIIGTVGGKLVMGFLREYVSKFVAPFWYDQFS